MRALITGGAGFVGSHLVRALLERGDSVVVLDSLETGRRENLASLREHPRLDFRVADVQEPFEHGVDVVFHLASPASPVAYQRDPVRTVMTNVLGTRNALECARSADARFVLASTSEVYGDPAVHPQTESYTGDVDPHSPRACYDEGKRVAETLVVDYGRMHGVSGAIARIFNTYGPRMRPDDGRVVPTFFHQARLGQPLTVAGDGSQTRSFMYVSDLVRGLLLLAESDFRGAVNLGNPEEISIAALAREVLAVTGSTSAITHVPVPPADPRRRRPDITRAREILGWSPTVPLARGLRDLWDTAVESGARSVRPGSET